MKLRRHSAALILMAALLCATPAAAAGPSMADSSGLFQMAEKLLVHVAAWLVASPATPGTKSTEQIEQQMEETTSDPEDQEGTVFDPHGRLSGAR